VFQVKLDESNSTRRRIPVLLVDATDGYTPETGLSTFTVNVSQNGTILGSQTQTVTEVGNGVYYYTLGTGAVNTLGWVTINVSATGCRQYNAIVQIMAYDAMDSTGLGLSRIDTNIGSRQATVTFPANFSDLAITASTGRVAVETNADKTGYSLATAPPTAVAITDAVWSANISTNSAATAWANDTMGKRVLRSSSNTDASEAVVADAVWAENLSSYNTNNTAGKIVKDLSTLAPTITGNTTNDVTATTTVFSVDRNDSDDTYNGQTIVFTSGLLNGVSAHIIDWVKDGSHAIVTVEDPLPSAPQNNTSFYISAQHVLSKTEIAQAVLTEATSTSTYAAGDVGNVLGRLVNMIAADGADFQFTANALDLAPSGGGGGGGSTTVRMGPFVIKAEGQGSDEPLDINKGATHAIECQLVDAEGTGVDITGATLTAKVYNSAGTLVETVSGTISYAALGQVRWTIGTTTTNTAGTYTVTITRTTGASDTQIFGPLRVYVRDI
jgi:hypothetical protein